METHLQAREISPRARGQTKSMDAVGHRNPKELLTIPALAREYGIGVKTIRREAKRGSLPVYSVGTCRPRARRHEFERWVRSTRTPVGRHAARRLEEVLERERSGRTGRRGARGVDGIAR